MEYNTCEEKEPCKPQSDLSSLEEEVKSLMNLTDVTEGNVRSALLVMQCKDRQTGAGVLNSEEKKEPKNRIISLCDQILKIKHKLNLINNDVSDIKDIVGN